MALTKEKAEEVGKLIPKRIRTRIDDVYSHAFDAQEKFLHSGTAEAARKKLAQQKKDVLDYIAELLAHDNRNPANGV